MLLLFQLEWLLGLTSEVPHPQSNTSGFLPFFYSDDCHTCEQRTHFLQHGKRTHSNSMRRPSPTTSTHWSWTPRTTGSTLMMATCSHAPVGMTLHWSTIAEVCG